MAKPAHFSGLIEMPDVCLIRLQDARPGTLYRGLNVEKGYDNIGTLGQCINGKPMNIQVVLNALEKRSCPHFAALRLKLGNGIGRCIICVLPVDSVRQFFQDRREVAMAKC